MSYGVGWRSEKREGIPFTHGSATFLHAIIRLVLHAQFLLTLPGAMQIAPFKRAQFFVHVIQLNTEFRNRAGGSVNEVLPAEICVVSIQLHEVYKMPGLVGMC